MGRSKGGVNKSELIRDYLREYPGSRTKDIVEHFKGQGMEVSQQLVSVVRSKEGMGVGMLSEVRLSELKAVKDFVSKSELDPSVAVQILDSFSDLVDSIGGIARFRRVLLEYSGYLNGEKEEEGSSEGSSEESSYMDPLNDDDD